MVTNEKSAQWSVYLSHPDSVRNYYGVGESLTETLVSLRADVALERDKWARQVVWCEVTLEAMDDAQA